MTADEFAQRAVVNLPYVPGEQQAMVMTALARFCFPETSVQPYGSAERVFLLKGYAGTGKTSLTGALVKTLTELHVPVVLLAPTGRAAKVFGSYAGHPAYTIHRKIYRHRLPGDFSSDVPAMQTNKLKNAVFIVDEASMIGASDRNGDNLLRDLIHFVYTGENCRMILMGDTAQLPPVGCTESPAMNPEVLRSYGLKVTRAVLTETYRQGSRSGILYNATMLRKNMRLDPLPLPHLALKGFRDVKAVSGEDLAEALEAAYDRDGISETLLITRSNFRATAFNLAIRGNILYREEELTQGDLLLVGKNNYLWATGVKGLDFVANGDVMRVEKVYGTEHRYGFRFADVRLSAVDSGIEFDAKIQLDCLTADTATLTAEQTAQLYNGVMTDPEKYSPDTPADVRLKDLRTNPYFNSLQMKYAYAVTCHKAQGGQWKNVFVDMGYIPEDAMGIDFYRWLYTAVSRARGTLTFINAATDITDEGS